MCVLTGVCKLGFTNIRTCVCLSENGLCPSAWQSPTAYVSGVVSLFITEENSVVYTIDTLCTQAMLPPFCC